MPFSFQYNKTALQALGKQLKIRQGALPILKNKESALRVEVMAEKQKIKSINNQQLQSKEKADYLLPLIGRFPSDLVYVDALDIDHKKIAGVKIPQLKSISLSIKEILWHEAPHWYPDVLSYLKEFAELNAKLSVAEQTLKILERERKRTTQKVNLYEKVQIPELEDALKKIKRFLEDKENLSKAAQKMVKARKIPV